MTFLATTNEETTPLLSVARLLNRDYALKLGCCHCYRDSVSFEDARMFLSAINGSPFLDCLSVERNIVSAMLQVNTQTDKVDIAVEAINGYCVVSLLGYNLFFGSK